MAEISSFDVFDTLLVRTVTDPSNLFLKIGVRLQQAGLLNQSPAAFRECRINAEQWCRSNCNAEDVTLTDIYRELAACLDWTEDRRSVAERIELELESESLRANPAAMDMVTEARVRNRRVVFVSDMYLPHTFVRTQLQRFGLFEKGDGCYVSSEHLLTKRSGNLFAHMLSHERVCPENVTHTGDNPHTDVASPRRIGIRACEYGAARPNRYEVLIESFARSTDGLAAEVAGAARLARLSYRGHTDREEVLWEVGANIAAPIMTAYVLWVARQAQRADHKRLYFVARDGFLLHKIAARVFPLLGINVEIRYLYGSRLAWHLPSVDRLEREHLAWLLMPTYRLSLRTVLSRIEVQPEEIAEQLEKAGFPSQHWDTALSSVDLDRLGSVLTGTAVAEFVGSRVAGRRTNTVAYLEQEGLLDHDRWAIVDIGWQGNMQSSLAALLGRRTGERPRGYYFRLTRRPENAGEMLAYFSDRAMSLGCVSDMPGPIMMEMFCTADHEMTVSYDDEGGCIVPRFDRDCGRLRAWGVETVQQAVMSFADQFARNASTHLLNRDLRPMICALANLWWAEPEFRHARVWGTFPFEMEQSGQVFQTVAAPFSWLQCLYGAVRGKLAPRSWIEWEAASIMLTPPIRLSLLRCRQQVVKCATFAKRVLTPEMYN